MSMSSPRLALPLIAPAQAQKHVTVNEALMAVDALAQLSVLDRTRDTPPATPAEGDRHIIGPLPTGPWAGMAGQIAVRQDGGWMFHLPRAGWRAWIEAEDRLVVHDGSGWAPITLPVPAELSLDALGIGSSPSPSHALTVTGSSVLLTHGGSDHRLLVNKAGIAQTASAVFQTAFSGRAEIGLTGDDRLRFKVSADGASWQDALVIEPNSGFVGMPATGSTENLLLNGDFAINQRNFAGGALVAGAYGFDRWKADAGGATLNVSAGFITLSAGALVQVIEAALSGSLAGQVVTLAVEDLSGGSLAVAIGAQTATIAPGAGRRSVTLTIGQSESGNLAVRLAPSASACSFRQVRLCRGPFASPWFPRPIDERLASCRRYYQAATASPVLTAVCRSATTMISQRIPLDVPMRALPMLAIAPPAGGTPGLWRYLDLPSNTWIDSTTTSTAFADEAGFSVEMIGTGRAIGQAILVSGNWTAAAEL